MIPKQVEALFKFIDFLNDNKKVYINDYIPLCIELKALDEKRRDLNPDENYKSKQLYDKVQSEIKEKFSPLLDNIYSPITAKLQELEIWSGDEIFTSIWNNNIGDVGDFKRNFTSEDIDVVMEYKEKYISFRGETNSNFMCLSLIIRSLDEILKELFDFFKDTNENEFSSFEAKVVEGKNLEDAIKTLIRSREENLSFSIPLASIQGSVSKNQEKLISQVVQNNYHIGDKINTGEISSKSGQIIVGKENKNEITGSDELAKKSFQWTKWLGIIAIVVTIIIAIFQMK
jgi:hypothetical protein